MIAWPALALMMVASVGSIAQLSDSATFGLGAVTVYLIPALLFLLPVGLVSAELATSHEGGIFVWVREAFGDRTGFQATWFVFMNSVTLYPSLLSFGAAALATALGRPDLAGNGAYMGTVVLVGFWAATGGRFISSAYLPGAPVSCAAERMSRAGAAPSFGVRIAAPKKAREP